MPFGAELREDGEVAFRLWAPAALSVAVALDAGAGSETVPMNARGDGWFETAIPGVGAGHRYCYRIDDAISVPDPAARFQPEDVGGRSEVVDSLAFDWPDAGWRGRAWHEAVIYELHIGAFSPEGTFAGAEGQLDRLVELGVTAIELMPLAESPGGRNWGYDGVLPFAPEAQYGRPDDLKRLVAAAHGRGLMVLLDVVYNHFGPEGNYLHRYAPQFFTTRHATPWGDAINFDGEGGRVVRDFFIHNALYWIDEFSLDGLRLDAVHTIHDDSHPDFLTELATRIHAGESERGRPVHLILENEDNTAGRLLRDRTGRPVHYTAQWNDDIHHVLHVLTTGEREGYYGDFADRPIDHLGRALIEGFVFQGEPSLHRGGKPRGEASAHLPPTAFVSFLQNHDQIGNRAFGDRIVSLAPEAAVRFAVTVLLLAPPPPLLFMGEEWGSDQPFPFFCDFGPDLADKVREGRRREFARFAAFADPAARDRIPDPLSEATFALARLDWSARETPGGRRWLELYRTLLSVRHREIVPRLSGLAASHATCERPGGNLLVVRWSLADGAILTLVAVPGAESAPQAAAWPSGRCLASTDASARRSGASLPGWYAGWFLDIAGTSS